MYLEFHLDINFFTDYNKDIYKNSLSIYLPAVSQQARSIICRYYPLILGVMSAFLRFPPIKVLTYFDNQKFSSLLSASEENRLLFIYNQSTKPIPHKFQKGE